MDKNARARIIKGQVQFLDQRQGKTLRNDTNFAMPEMRFIEVAGHWQATITRNQFGASMGERGSEGQGRDLLSVHVDGELKLALRFSEDQQEIIVFKPGIWETWFCTYDPYDLEAIAPSS